jgi:hypothetical protein
MTPASPAGRAGGVRSGAFGCPGSPGYAVGAFPDVHGCATGGGRGSRLGCWWYSS